MLYCVNKDKIEKMAGAKTAGKKAPDDITELTCRMGGQRISFTQDDSSINNSLVRKLRNIYYSFKDWGELYKTVQEGDIVVIQHPYEGIQAGARFIPKMKRKGVVIICLIHDIRALRDSIDEKSAGALINSQSNQREIQLLALCNYIIAHNGAMKTFLVDRFEIDRDNIYELEIFDYLCSERDEVKTIEKSIAVAGNLSPLKCKYLYELLEKGIVSNPFHLYGPNYTGKSKTVTYHGVVPPSELPSIMQGSFGLVWDGDEVDRCGGVAGEYLKYNNPHKCSLYLAAGIPVIIWREAALATFVEENNCGLVVDSLLDVNEGIDQITDEQYVELTRNAKAIGRKLRSGYYYCSIINKIMKENHLG